MNHKPTIYLVTAFRYGIYDAHSYPVGIFDKKHAAIAAAEAEEERRGGNKYICEVREFPGLGTDFDESKVIRPIKVADWIERGIPLCNHPARFMTCPQCGRKEGES